MLINKGWTWTIADVCIKATSHWFTAADIWKPIYAENSGTRKLAIADNTNQEWTRLLKKICSPDSIVLSLDRDIIETPIAPLMESTFTWTLAYWDFLFTSETQPWKFTLTPTAVSNPMAEYIDANNIRFYPYRAYVIPGSTQDIDHPFDIECVPISLVANVPFNLTTTWTPSIIGSVIVTDSSWQVEWVEINWIGTANVTLLSNATKTGKATIIYKK